MNGRPEGALVFDPTMDHEDLRCPTCGGPVRERFETVVQDGMRVPVDPYLECAEGHRTGPPPSVGQAGTGDHTARRGAELIG
jgi:hypothetical protein